MESLPDVNFDIGEMYAGLLPIASNDTSRELFFIFQPKIGEPVDEVTIWLNGGPGCSSLEGFLQENGRFTWQPGTYLPVENDYSWVNLTNMLWVDQPVGTGFSIGKPTAGSEEDIARDFLGFFKNFETTFGIKNYKIYITGESYAGRYVPYISSAMLDTNDTTYFDLSGALVYDPVIGSTDYIQEELPTLPFIQSQAAMFNFQEDFMANLTEMDESCGYKAFRDKYLVFPPAGVQPIADDRNVTRECDIWGTAFEQAQRHNPCFDIYEVNLQCPLLYDVVGFPTTLVQDQTNGNPGLYFNRTDVKTAIHAPQQVDWTECSNIDVFPGGDNSDDPIQRVLPHVIERTNRVLVSNGDLDMIIITNGTLLAIQNMTWNGDLGFQEAPSTPIDITLPDLQYKALFQENGYGNGGDDPQGIMGIQHYERGLMWAETYLSGHMQPQFQSRTTYRHLQWLLGHIETL